MPGNIPLDPNQWETPKSRGIAIIKVCRYQTTDDSKTHEGITFTDFFQLPRAAQTWRVELLRLDAVYVNKVTGERLQEVKRYQTLQLERYDNERKVWRTATQGDNKNQYILEKWLKAGIRLVEPELNEGTVIEYELEATHKFGGNIAKNLLYPLKVLARPGQPYEYRGVVEEFEFDPDRESAASLDQSAAEVEAASASTSTRRNGQSASKLDEAGIMALLVGIDPENEDAIEGIVREHRAELETAQRTALISGTFVQDAIEGGKLVVVDGVFALA